jgi:hypothetical protein
MDNNTSQSQQTPRPNPSLRALDRFIGTWSMKGRTAGADEDNISGTTRFEKLPGGFFVKQHIQMDFAGYPIDALEIIGYNKEKDGLTSLVYTTTDDPLPYSWKVEGDKVEISVVYGVFDASFHGEFLLDGTYKGGWRPNPGADKDVNVPYDVVGSRID